MDNGNQAAFPREWSKIKQHPDAPELVSVAQKGLTKREYFASMAMQGLLSNPEWMKDYKGEKYLMNEDVIAQTSIQIADKLLTNLT